MIGNQIWVDANNDGLLNNGESLITVPVTVSLVDATTGAVVAVVVTTNGVYTFSGIVAGDYVVSMTVPAGYTSSTPTNATPGVDGNDNGTPSGSYIVSAAFEMVAGTNDGAITTDAGTATTAGTTRSTSGSTRR